MGTNTKNTAKETLESGITLKEAKVHKLVIKGNRNYFELHKVKTSTNDLKKAIAQSERIFIDTNTNIADFKKACAKYIKDLD